MSSVIKPPLTKIIATLGPASSSPEMIERLIEAGVGIFRLNFSHGNEDEHAQYVQRVREVAKRRGQPIAVLGDLQGPKIRVGQVVSGGVEVKPGDSVIFQRDDCTADRTGPPFRFCCTYPQLFEDVRVGDRVLIDDGAIRMLSTHCAEDELVCSVLNGGTVLDNKGINLPDSKLSAPALSERDWEWAMWAVDHGIDLLALSFVESAADIENLRSRLREHAQHGQTASWKVPIIAKIERKAAVENFEDIVHAADAVMIARGDLGVEMEPARVPVIQKRMLTEAQHIGKPVIVATQMLQSMISAPTPTRAEATDVANAIFEGTDAVMLSGETAVGQYPILAVEMMRRIAYETEDYIRTLPHADSAPLHLVETQNQTAALAHGAFYVARDLGAKFIVVWSQHGGGARYLSQNNFTIPIIAVSTSGRALRQMQLLRSVTPVHVAQAEDLAHFTLMIDAYVQEAGWAEPGEKCVLVAGGPVGQAGVTNSLAVHTVGSGDTGYIKHTSAVNSETVEL